MRTQVSKQHYDRDYDSVERFISYFYQCSLILNLKPNKVLEIGVGNRVTSSYLKNNNIKVVTCDIAKDLNPDVIASVTNLPFKNNEFDCVICYQVLEHLPFEDFNKALSEIKRVSKNNAVISLPYSSSSFEFLIKMPLINKIFKKNYFDFFFRIPKFYKTHKFDGQHYWEIGARGYNLRNIRIEIEKHFSIVKELRPEINSYHYFFVLEKK